MKTKSFFPLLLTIIAGGLFSIPAYGVSVISDPTSGNLIVAEAESSQTSYPVKKATLVLQWSDQSTVEALPFSEYQLFLEYPVVGNFRPIVLHVMGLRSSDSTELTIHDTVSLSNQNDFPANTLLLTLIKGDTQYCLGNEKFMLALNGQTSALFTLGKLKAHAVVNSAYNPSDRSWTITVKVNANDIQLISDNL